MRRLFHRSRSDQRSICNSFLIALGARISNAVANETFFSPPILVILYLLNSSSYEYLLGWSSSNLVSGVAPLLYDDKH